MKCTVEEMSKIIEVKDFKIGNAGFIIDPGQDCDGQLVLRLYGGIVSLENPRNTWLFAEGDFSSPAFKIELLREDTIIKLELE